MQRAQAGRVKHISFADKAFFLDDATADSIVEYAGVLGAEHSADTIRVRGVGPDGNEVEMDFVLNSATNLMSESTNSDLEPPTNEEAVAYMRERISVLRLGTSGLPLDPAETLTAEDF